MADYKIPDEGFPTDMLAAGKIREAAASCRDAARILKLLFPSAFETKESEVTFKRGDIIGYKEGGVGKADMLTRWVYFGRDEAAKALYKTQRGSELAEANHVVMRVVTGATGQKGFVGSMHITSLGNLEVKQL